MNVQKPEEHSFEKILVGVDLSSGDSLVSEDLSPPTLQAVTRATRLALAHRAELHFFFALDLGPQTQRLIEMTRGLSDNVLDASRTTLKAIEEEAARQGIRTRSTVVFGKSWLELIRQSLRDGSDLVVVGTRHLGRLRGALVGSTGMRLLRKCPCPVWITQPDKDSRLDRILVATDFSPACRLALDMAASIAVLDEANLYLLHVLDLPREAHFGGLLEQRTEYRSNRDQLERDARAELNRHSSRLADERKPPPQVLLLDGKPDQIIREQVDELRIDLLVMGTMARTGVPGLIMGNTAERLLPVVDCSILAVKPPGYEPLIEA